MRSILPLVPALCLALPAQDLPLRVGLLPPVDVDLRGADPAALLPADPRDPAQAEKSRLALEAFLAPALKEGTARSHSLALRPPLDPHATSGQSPEVASKGQPALRFKLPTGPARVQLLLAAARTAKVLDPSVRLYVAPEAAEPWMEEQAWGAVDGGALLPEDLGPDPARWREKLTEAQSAFPGRPWFLWLPRDPGALAGALLGDGGRLVLPAEGPTARLAAQLPAGALDLEGGPGDLLVHPRGGGPALRWRFLEGAWRPAELPKEGTRVTVVDAATYDLGSLLAKVRAFQARARLAATTLQSTVDLTLRMQGGRLDDAELGFTFDLFEKRGEQPEMLQKEVRFNGVRALLKGEVQLPIVEARSSLARPLELALNEAYRYRDLGAAGPGRRRVGFTPVESDARLYQGELLVEEATGRILEETRERDGLPGTVRSERVTLTYGEAAPGFWRVTGSRSFERWIGASGIVQVQRRFAFRDFRADAPDFEARRDTARKSESTMLRDTPDGARYLTRQSDGTRKLEERPRTSGRALAGLVLVDPGLTPPVVPAGGFTWFDFNAFGKGGQFTTLVAGVFNTANLTQPLGAGMDLHADATVLLLKMDDRPVENGRLLAKDAVGRRFGRTTLGLGRDLGKRFRLEGQAAFLYESFSEPKDDKYATPGFLLPPSGWTREGRLRLSWLWRGLDLRASHGWGQRPDGSFGAPGEVVEIPENGRFTRWGVSAAFSREVALGWWLKAQTGVDAGRAFDRFNSLDVGGSFGGGAVPGIRSNALSADRIASGHLILTLPSAPSLRLSASLSHARARALDDGQTYRFTGLGLKGDLPGFGWFTAARVDLGVGLQSDVPGTKTVNGYVALLRVF